MAGATLVLPPEISRLVNDALGEDLETAGVLLVGEGTGPHGAVRLLARELHLVPEQSYEKRERDQLVITSEGYVPALARAQEIGATALWFHTHPGAHASPQPSARDRRVDEQITDLFRLRSASERYGAVIFAREPAGGLAFSGHFGTASETMPIARLWEVGRRLRLSHATDQLTATQPIDEMFDRNVRALGGAVQQVLASLSIAVVGCGGTGSAVAEQLVRLGVRSLTLIDPDHLSESNLTRVYGSTPQHVGQNKAAVLGEHLTRIAPEAKIRTIVGTINGEPVARELIENDVVFGCTDDNAGRLVLSRYASYFLTPVIDCGVLLSSDEHDLLTGIDGRVTILTPGDACLVCRDRIDLARAQAEVLPVDERARLQREGYAAALPGVEPAVVSFTTAIAAVATSELLERLLGYGPEPAPSEILARFHEREISSNSATPRKGHYCDPQAGKLGRGETEPFLEQTWAS
jgi:molybdopterin/thiamine biosynthesis adenylyltransferase/proteasome lid subunit RPN8/RPN11